MDEAIVEHLKKKMHVTSGSATDTYILPIQKQEAYLDFRSQYKTILGTLSSLLDPKVDEDDCDGKDTSLFSKNRVLRHLQKLLANPNLRVGRWKDRERAKQKVKMQRKSRSGNHAVGTSNSNERNTTLVDLKGGAMSYAVVPRIPEPAFSSQQSPAAGEERDRIPDFEHARQLIESESGCHSDIGKRNENDDDRSHRIANAQLSSLAPEKWLKSTTIDSYLSLVAKHAAKECRVRLRVWPIDSTNWDPNRHTPIAGDREWSQRTFLRVSRIKEFGWSGGRKKVGTEGPRGYRLPDVLLLPWNVSSTHWVLGIMWLAGPAGPAFEIWDSLSSLTAPEALQEQAGIMIRDIVTPAFLDLFDDTKSKEAQEQLRAALERNIAFPKAPQQTNGYDCGVFLCSFALHRVTSNEPMSSAVDPATVQTELRYRMALDLEEGRIHYTKNDRESAVSESESESDADTVVPPSYKYYWRTIRSWKDINGRRLYYKMCLKEDTCEICKSIPEVEAEVNATTEALRAYKEAAASIAGSSGVSSGSIDAAAAAATTSSSDTPQLGVGDPVYAKLLQKQQEIFFRSETIKRHLQQYQTQRQYLQERERNLPKKSPGDFRVIVYEDFVAQFDTNGQKVINLVFTFLWRDENGALQRKYINNFHTDGEKNNKKLRKQDAPFVIQVWKFHLEIRKYQREGDDTGLKVAISKGLSVEFSEVTHILRTGDSGSHFHALVNVAFESSVYQDYSVKWETSHPLQEACLESV